MREAKALARSCVHAGSSEPSPHTNVIRTIISCADQFIVLIFHGELRNIVRAHISRLVSLLVIKINSKCLFLIMGSKLLQVNKYTLSYQLLYGNVQGRVFVKNQLVGLYERRTYVVSNYRYDRI